MEEDIEYLNDRVKELEEQVRDLEDQIDDLESDNAELEDEKYELQEKIGDLEYNNRIDLENFIYYLRLEDLCDEDIEKFISYYLMCHDI